MLVRLHNNAILFVLPVNPINLLYRSFLEAKIAKIKKIYTFL